MKAVVAGGTGLAGSKIVDTLRDRGITQGRRRYRHRGRARTSARRSVGGDRCGERAFVGWRGGYGILRDIEPQASRGGPRPVSGTMSRWPSSAASRLVPLGGARLGRLKLEERVRRPTARTEARANVTALR